MKEWYHCNQLDGVSPCDGRADVANTGLVSGNLRHIVLKRIEKNWKDSLITKNDTFMAELWSFVELVSCCEFFESSNVTLVFIFTA